MDEATKDWLDSMPGYLELDDLERFKICNGCGSAQSKFDFVPDTVYGLSMREACYRHDYAYHWGKTEAHKRAADRQFLANMLTIIEQQSSNSIIAISRSLRAIKYYIAVRDHGHSAFWAGKQR